MTWMTVLYVLGYIALFMVVAIICFGIYVVITQRTTSQSTVVTPSQQLMALVDSVNKVNHYAYIVDKNQHDNLRNIDSNVRSLKKRMDEYDNSLSGLTNTVALKSDVMQMQQNRNVFESVKVADFDIRQVDDDSLYISNGSQNSTVGVRNMAIQGGLTTVNPIQSSVQNGPLIEQRNTSTNERYGVGRYNSGTTRVYSANKVAFSQARSNGSFVDIMEVNPDVIVANKPLCIGSRCFVSSSDGLLLCPINNPSATNPQCKNLDTVLS